jgi:transcription elongation factor Elf1
MAQVTVTHSGLTLKCSACNAFRVVMADRTDAVDLFDTINDFQEQHYMCTEVVIDNTENEEDR